MEGAAGETSMDRDVRTTRQDGWAARVIAAVAIGAFTCSLVCLGILTAPSDIGWERVPGGGIVMSMNIRVAGLGTKFHPPRQMWRTGDIGTVRGTMRWALPGKSGAALFQEMFGN